MSVGVGKRRPVIELYECILVLNAFTVLTHLFISGFEKKFWQTNRQTDGLENPTHADRQRLRG